MTELSCLLPLDVHGSPPEFANRLRPEFLAGLENPISADGFIGGVSSKTVEWQNWEASEAEATHSTVGTSGLTHCVTAGLEGRHFVFTRKWSEYTVFRTTRGTHNTPTYKDLMCVEIIARTAKHILNQQFTELNQGTW